MNTRLPKYEPAHIPPGNYQMELHDMPEMRSGKNDNVFLIFKFLLKFLSKNADKIAIYL